MLKHELMVNDAVHVRSWLLKLENGNALTIVPGSIDHDMLNHLVEYIEVRMRGFARRKNQGRKKLNDANPKTVSARRSRVRKAAKVRKLVRKYFEIHGDR